MNMPKIKDKKITDLDELTQLFLLFQYTQMTEKQKRDFNKRNIQEIVYRTTKIEEPYVTRRMVKAALKRK